MSGTIKKARGNCDMLRTRLHEHCLSAAQPQT